MPDVPKHQFSLARGNFFPPRISAKMSEDYKYELTDVAAYVNQYGTYLLFKDVVQIGESIFPSVICHQVYCPVILTQAHGLLDLYTNTQPKATNAKALVSRFIVCAFRFLFGAKVEHLPKTSSFTII